MINVILADHERIFRIGMASTLAAEDDIRIVGQPATPVQLIRGMKNLHPHVVVLSSSFLTWIGAIQRACARQSPAILLLRDYGVAEGIGYSENFQAVVDRSADEQTIVQHVRHLARGERVVRPRSAGEHAKDMDAVADRVRQRLTAEEMAIIAYVVRGYRNREIASEMGTTEPSIKNALRRIFDTTGVYGRLELALFVLHHGMVIAVPEAVAGHAKPPALGAPVGDGQGGRPPRVN